MLLYLAIGAVSFLLGRQFPVIGGPVFAILLGMVITLAWKDKSKVQAGITFTSKKILQWAVVLPGFGLKLSVILQTGAQSLPMIMATISASPVLACCWVGITGVSLMMQCVMGIW